MTEKTKAGRCVDPVVGGILSSWRYDISGLDPDMRRDYEQHFVDCAHCRTRQRVHRTIDVVLIVVSTGSILSLLIALAVIHKIEPVRHLAVLHLHIYELNIAVSMQQGALIGLACSFFVWMLVALMTPAPQTIGGYARDLGGQLGERLPENLKERLEKISAS
jgi:hypothetical protein